MKERKLIISEQYEIVFQTRPQSPSDTPFRKRMRLHQSKFRADKLKVDFGFGPTVSSNRRYGNMLKTEDGNRGLNFLDPKIFEAVKKRIAKKSGAVETFRLLNNMLSSQPLCFNLFGLMDEDTELATDFWKIHFPERVKRITKVEFEFAPLPKEKYLSDSTAFDVYFEYLNKKDENGFVNSVQNVLF